MSPAAVRSIFLDYDTVLVLFELLHRWEDEQQVSGPASRAEQIALWNLTANLEPEVDEAFSSSYGDAVRAASARLEGGA